MDHLYILWKSDLSRANAQIRAAKSLAESGYQVTMVVAAAGEPAKASLASQGIGIQVLGGYPGFGSNWWTRLRCVATFWLRVVRWWASARRTGCKLVVGSLETACAVLPLLLFEPFAVFVQELYDREPRWRLFRSFVLRRARLIIAPTHFRAALLRYWCGLRATPFVMENRPSATEPCAAESPQALTAVRLMRAARANGKRILLYQGNIDLRERDLLPVARACQEDKWVFTLMGDDFNSVSTLRAVCPSLVYLGRLDSQEHLAVTAECDVGVVSYRWDSLNTLFCAPNKTWEYSKFGKPMLANDVPALAATMERFGCGISVDFQKPQDVARALDELLRNYQSYSDAAIAYYNSYNEEAVSRGLIREIAAAFGTSSGDASATLTSETVQ